MKLIVFCLMVACVSALRLHPPFPHGLCADEPVVIRCNDQIALDKLHLLSEQAGYSVNLEAVKRRTDLFVNDVRRLGKKYGVPVENDLKCIQQVICQIEISPEGLQKLIDKNFVLFYRLFNGKVPDSGEFQGVQFQIRFLQSLKHLLEEYAGRNGTRSGLVLTPL
ncbi:unnamed protein product [Bursaphelenchus xylophilus]|uniref:(pine wood nematode) hypothetical protein n=1 Tax=Bursaphelenchus xylophilus TaxID=6326 RepID=A0A1I7RZ50_BURXY|nr:unnamed protein product [Bursaphelenchus xylophilus]CAG9106852.1 unnamed protein product [Bursaphelenchus xylophilus]